MITTDRRCRDKGCQNLAEDTIWPDDGDPIHVCSGHAKRDEITLDDGSVLVWSSWDGWVQLPEKWEPKP